MSLRARPSSLPIAPTLLRLYLMVGAALLAFFFLLYFHGLTRRVEQQTELMSELLARFVVVAASTVTELPDTTGAMQYQDIIRDANFPIVVSDPRGMPMVWNFSQIGQPLISVDSLLAMSPQEPTPSVERVMEIQRALDEQHDPIHLWDPRTGALIGNVHYGSPSLSKELQWVPVASVVAAAIFGLTALLGFRSIKRSEQSFVWAGLAKESAHQMGTPLSSLVGWLEVLRSEVNSENDQVTLPRELYDEIVLEIGRDADRLNRVAQRFSQIGSSPKLESGDVADTITQTVDYFRGRLPHGEDSLDILLETEAKLPHVQFNKVLLGWVVENLIKNAMNAVETMKGEVRVRVEAVGREVVISVQDNGKGIEPGMEKQVFRPGVSSRTRGWGLGLPLSRRIIQEYHGGKLELFWTRLGAGSEFRISLPALKD